MGRPDRIVVVEAPETAGGQEPITLADLKAHLRVQHDLEDSRLSAAIAAARAWLEGFTRRAIPQQLLYAYLDAWPTDGVVELPRPPLQGLVEVAYLPEAGGGYATATLSDYEVDATDPDVPGRVRLLAGATAPAARSTWNAWRLKIRAGYPAAAVPPDLAAAVRLLAGHLYENPTPLADGAAPAPLAFSLEALAWPFRVLRWDL